MRVSQRQLNSIVGGKSSSDVHSLMSKLKDALAKDPIEKIVYVKLPPVEKIVTLEKVVEKVVEIEGPTVEKIVERIVAAPQPIYSFVVKDRNAQGNITRITASSRESKIRYDFNAVRDSGGKLTRITMKAVNPDDTPGIYRTLQ